MRLTAELKFLNLVRIVIHSAALRCDAGSVDRIGYGEWEPFVEQLESMLETVCGASVALWISKTARGIHWGLPMADHADGNRRCCGVGTRVRCSGSLSALVFPPLPDEL